MGSTAWNPIRDTIFLGNQDVYDGGYFIANLTASFGPSAVTALGAAKATGLAGSAALPAFAKSFAGDLAKDAAVGTAVDFTFTSFVDPQIDKYFAGTKTGEALKGGGRDITGNLASGFADKSGSGSKAGATSSAGDHKAVAPSSPDAPKPDGGAPVADADVSPDVADSPGDTVKTGGGPSKPADPKEAATE